MRKEDKKIRTQILLDIASEMENTSKNSESTLRYCVEEDLKNNGYDVYSCEVLNKDELDKNTLQKVIDILTENIDKHQDELDKLTTDNLVNSMEELRLNTKTNGMRIAREIVCKMYRGHYKYR